MNMRRCAVAAFAAVVCALAATSPALADPSGKIVVANRASASISVIDAKFDALLGNVPLPAGANTPEPMYVVNTQYKNRVWVGDRANNRVVVFDGDTFEVVTTLPTGSGVFHMEADDLDRQLWVVNDVDETATVIDPKALEVITTIDLPDDLPAAAIPHDVILDPFGAFAYISFFNVDPDFDLIVQFDTETFEEVNRAEVGKIPHVSFNPRTYEVYSPCQGSSAVFILDGLTLDPVDAIDIPNAHGATESPNGKRFYTTNITGGGADAVFCVDTKTNEVVGEPGDTPTNTPHNLAMSKNGKKLYVTHSGGGNNKVSVFDTSGNGAPLFLHQVTVQFNPFGLAFVK